MFERYTAKARRVIFFARYEVSQFGASAIETEHLLLGLLREEKSILSRFFPVRTSIDLIRKQIEGHVIIREKISTSLEIPLSGESKNVLRYGAEEADSLSHREIRPEHLFLGLLREKGSLGANILRENGVEYAAVRKELEKYAEG
jgi:ATP-dependent Clp protease ATP-binding subunit ClpC